MNIAAVLTRSSVPEFDAATFQGLLRREVQEITSELFAFAGADMEPDAFPLPGNLEDEIAQASQWAQVIAPAFATPVEFDTMEETGQAGVILLDDGSLNSILEGATRDDSRRPRGLWIEAQPMETDWIVYPQDDSLDLRFLLWLPISVRSGAARLTALELPIPTLTSSPPRSVATVKGTSCAPVFDRSGPRKRWVCDDAGCSVPCDGRWQTTQGIRLLFDCDC